METISTTIHQHLSEKAHHVLLISHPRPDGDTLSAACAFMQYLRRIGKKYTAFCTTAIPADLLFLPGSREFTSDVGIFSRTAFDTICFFDTGDLRHAGVETLMQSLPYRPTIVNIDHHHTNTLFGTHNLVLTDAASTTETLYHFFQENHIAITSDMATAILTGLVTDTGNFSNQATTPTSVRIAADLMAAGADFGTILSNTSRNKSMRALQLWGLMLSRLTYVAEHHVTYTFIRREERDAMGATDDDIDGLANFLNSLGEGRAVIVLREIDGDSVKGSMRTTKHDMDVSAIAAYFGGGGHKKAAGFTLKNAQITDAATAWKLLEPAFLATMQKQ